MSALDFSLADLDTIKTEVQNGLSVLIEAGDVVAKFAAFLPAPLGADVATAVAVLTELETLLEKL